MRYQDELFDAALKQVRKHSVASAFLVILLSLCSIAVFCVALFDRGSPLWSRIVTSAFAIVGLGIAIFALRWLRLLAITARNLIAGRGMQISIDRLESEPHQMLSLLNPALGTILRDRSSGLYVYSGPLGDQALLEASHPSGGPTDES